MGADNSTEGGALNNATFQTSGGGSPSGLVLDLSKVSQVNQTGEGETAATTAYRERIVPGSDDGKLQSFDRTNGQILAVVAAPELVELLTELVTESRRQTRLLLMLINETTSISIGHDDLDQSERT